MSSCLLINLRLLSSRLHYLLRMRNPFAIKFLTGGQQHRCRWISSKQGGEAIRCRGVAKGTPCRTRSNSMLNNCLAARGAGCQQDMRKTSCAIGVVKFESYQILRRVEECRSLHLTGKSRLAWCGSYRWHASRRIASLLALLHLM